VMKRNLAKPCTMSKEGWIIPYLAGAGQMSGTMVDLSPGIGEQRRGLFPSSTCSSFSWRKMKWSRLWQGLILTRCVMWQLMATCVPMRSRTPCSTPTEPLSRAWWWLLLLSLLEK